MIRNLKKYYRRERFTYGFLSLLPFIFLTEILVYYHGISGREASMQMVLQFLMIICLVAGIGIAIYQMVTNVKFYKSLKLLPPEIQEACKIEIPQRIKRGRYLLTQNVLIYYGMLTKKVYQRKDIAKWKRDKGVYSQDVPRAGRVSVPYDNTLIYLKKGFSYADRIEYPIDPLESEYETKGELPWNAFLVVFVSIVFTASMMLYPRILAKDAPGADIERFLFYSSYEVDYCLNAFKVTALSGLVAFVIRCIIKPIHFPKEKLVMKNRITLFCILSAVTLMFLVGAFGSWYDDVKNVREDLAAYYAGEFCIAEGRYKEKGVCLRNEVGFTVYDYAERNGFQPVLLEDPGYRLILLQSAFEELPQEGKTYQVEYLENTKIVVSFSKK